MNIFSDVAVVHRCRWLPHPEYEEDKNRISAIDDEDRRLLASTSASVLRYLSRYLIKHTNESRCLVKDSRPPCSLIISSDRFGPHAAHASLHPGAERFDSRKGSRSWNCLELEGVCACKQCVCVSVCWSELGAVVEVDHCLL